MVGTFVDLRNLQRYFTWAQEIKYVARHHIVLSGIRLLFVFLKQLIFAMPPAVVVTITTNTTTAVVDFRCLLLLFTFEVYRGEGKKEGLAVISSSHMWELYLPLNRLFASFISFACDKIAYVHGWKAISTDRRTNIRHGTNLKCTATKSSIFGWNSFATHSNLHTLPILPHIHTHTPALYTTHPYVNSYVCIRLNAVASRCVNVESSLTLNCRHSRAQVRFHLIFSGGMLFTVYCLCVCSTGFLKNIRWCWIPISPIWSIWIFGVLPSQSLN